MSFTPKPANPYTRALSVNGATAPIRLEIRANLAQFVLLVGVNALIGGMVGQEAAR